MFIRCLLIGILSGVSTFLSGQDNRSLGMGAGYFGETLSHPGAVANTELVNKLSTRYEIIHSINVGFYIHKRNHAALFISLNAGMRRTFKHFFLEQSIGVGSMLTMYNGDGIFQIDDHGAVRRASKFGNVDFMPSVNFGIGKKFLDDRSAYAYLRPKIFWQVPYNNLAQYRAAIEAGVVKTIRYY